MNDEHPAIAKLLAAQPNLGAGDESKCLPSWIKTFAEKWDAGEGITLSHNATGALCHTLVAARERTRRLVREREERAGRQAAAHEVTILAPAVVAAAAEHAAA